MLLFFLHLGMGRRFDSYETAENAQIGVFKRKVFYKLALMVSVGNCQLNLIFVRRLSPEIHRGGFKSSAFFFCGFALGFQPPLGVFI